MSTLQVATIKAAQIGIYAGRGGGNKAPAPADCMKDCIAWYSPKRQGITNKYLQDHYLDDDAVLQDLSGNGNHIALHNMEGEEGGGYVNEDGDLVFDGVDDVGKGVNTFATSDMLNGAFACVVDTSYVDNYKHIYFALTTAANPTNNSYLFGFYKDGSGAGRYYTCYNKQLNKMYWMKNSDIEEIMLPHIANVFVGGFPYNGFSKKTIINFPSSSGQATATIIDQPTETKGYLTIGMIHSGFSKLIFRELLFFNRNLTPEEAEWVYDNILTTDTNNSNS